MNMFVVWTLFLAGIILIFAGLEGYALANNQPTLSRYVWTLSKEWPPFPYFVGFACGFLTCHFWWGGIVSFRPVSWKRKK
jgi:hypothetical protein